MNIEELRARAARRSLFSLPKLDKTRKTALIVGLCILVLAVVGSFFIPSSATTSFKPDQPSFDLPAMATEVPAVTTELTPTEEKPPQLKASPLDFVSQEWLKALQVLMALEFLGLLVAVSGDALVRKQYTDAIVPAVVALVAIFLTINGDRTAAIVVLVLELSLVMVVSLMGGRDFSPLALFFVALSLGGIFFQRMGVVESFGVSASPVQPLGDIITLIRLKSPNLWFNVAVYTTMLLAVGFAFFEAIRPSEDKNPRWGTLAGAAVGLAAFFVSYILISLSADLLGPISYLVGYSAAIGVAAVSQNERLMQSMSIKWGIRTMWDAPILLTVVLLLLQLTLGRVI